MIDRLLLYRSRAASSSAVHERDINLFVDGCCDTERQTASLQRIKEFANRWTVLKLRLQTLYLLLIAVYLFVELVDAPLSATP